MEVTGRSEPPRVVVVGAGFGGLTVARHLRKTRVGVTVVDRTNHHLFQPLLYQVAMAGLSPAEIAYPIRSILRRQRNAGFRNRFVVLFEWTWSYLTYQRGGRLIVGRWPAPRP